VVGDPEQYGHGMGRWTRDELEDAFAEYQRRGLEAGRTGDWNPWADQFTEDATYVEHHYGTMGGREAIRRWITETMGTFPGDAMPHFPVEWYVIDEERGWIVLQVWNRMADPGDGSLHQAYNFTLLKYAGNGLWSYEEDIYNPASFGSMVKEWLATKQRIEDLAT
jgi:SnoaL-like domain